MKRATTSPAPSLEVADIVREHGSQLLARYRTSTDQRRVLRAIARCRTASLGGHATERRC